MLVWAPIIVSIFSILIAAVGWLTRRPLDREQLAKLRREQLQEDDEREKTRRAADEERNRRRIDADERRNERTMTELEKLSEISNKRFQQWQDAVADLDELWSYMEDSMLPYQRRAYAEIRRLDPASNFGLPPPLPRRHRRNGSNGDV